MVFFWGAAALISAKMDRLRAAEATLLELAVSKARNFPIVRTVDTNIPASVISLSAKATCLSGTACEEGLQEYVIHGVEVTSDSKDSTSVGDKPLVLLHGYMNGGAYFYRNLAGLSQYFPKIHALDMLGWGLSSRPDFHALELGEDSVKMTEDFFVESLEAWRKEQNIDSMILAGHSMGGYLSVAYTERYPQHVDRLILISPVGVPEETPELLKERDARTKGFRYRMYEGLFPRYTPGDLLRAMPEKYGRDRIGQYITRRLPVITDTDEQEALADYLYLNNALPGSGEYCLPKLLNPFANGRKPLQHRIPALKVKSCSFLYGERDWMDANGGLLVEQACIQQKLQGQQAPDIDVYQVSKAGHLLMLENYEEFNNGLVMAAGHLQKLVEDAPLPNKLRPVQRQPTTPTPQGRQSEELAEAEVAM